MKERNILYFKHARLTTGHGRWTNCNFIAKHYTWLLFYTLLLSRRQTFQVKAIIWVFMYFVAHLHNICSSEKWFWVWNYKVRPFGILQLLKYVQCKTWNNHMVLLYSWNTWHCIDFYSNSILLLQIDKNCITSGYN